MPMNENERRIDRAGRRVNELRAWRNAREFPITDWTLTASDWHAHPLTIGDRWPVIEIPVKLQGTVAIPDAWAGLPVNLELWLGGEGLIKLSNGTSFGLNPYHHLFPVTDAATAGTTLTINAEVSPKGLFGANVADPRIERAHLVVPHPQVQALAMDLGLALGTCAVLENHEIVPQLLDLVENTLSVLSPTWPTATETTVNRHLLGYVNPLGTGVNTIAGQGNEESADVEPFYADMGGLWSTPDPTGGIEPLSEDALASVDEALAYFSGKLDRLLSLYPPIGHIYLTGHAHIDLAWLWPVHETRRKGRRTFATVLGLMERYPDFTFNQSSAQLYAWIEEDAPDLFARVKARVAEGRWEPIGGSWVEPDCEVTGGEAFVRQLLYGQRAFQQRFGQRSTVAWLPDVFGFSGGIPQLLRRAGSTASSRPSSTGTRRTASPTISSPGKGSTAAGSPPWMSAISGRIAATTAISPRSTSSAPGATSTASATTRRASLAFGWGDGGGGPTARMLENYARLEGVPGAAAPAHGPHRGVFRRAAGRRSAGLGGRALPGVPPRHADHPGPTKTLNRAAETASSKRKPSRASP